MNLLVELRFKGLTYRQTCKTYDLATLVFKEEIGSLDSGYRKLEVYFSKYRLVLWLKLGEERISDKGREVLIRAVTALLNRYKTSLSDVWQDISGLVVLLGNEVLPISVDSVLASDQTQAGNKFFRVRDAQHYWREMVRHRVLVDNGQREKAIRQLLASAASDVGGEILSSQVMNEVVVASEQPVLRLLKITDVMDLPEQLIKIIYDKYQCFGIINSQGKLLNYALYIANGNGDAPDLEAVLAKTRQTYAADLEVTIEKRKQLLAKMCYLSGLGSYLDKQKRLQKIALTIADQVEAGDAVCSLARQASEHAKLDLTTMTCERYPEFRGHMGGLIAQRAGVPEAVASAIVEHWCPGKYSSKLPHTLVGALLGIADRLDCICGHYYQSEFKLSHYRCVKEWFDEIIAILDSVAMDVSLTRLLKFSLSLYESQGLVPWREKDLVHLLKVFADRLYYYLLDREFSEEIANALTVINPDNVYTTLKKAAVMSQAANSDYVEGCAEVCQLLDRTSTKDYNYEEAAREFLEQPEEKDLFEVYLIAKDDILDSIDSRNFDQVLTRLAKLKTPLMRFVNSVDLDTDDKPVQFNRLSLLAEIRQLYHLFADFSMLL